MKTVNIEIKINEIKIMRSNGICFWIIWL